MKLYHPKFKKLLYSFPLMLDSENPKHILVFRRMLEWAMTNGYWNGAMASKS